MGTFVPTRSTAFNPTGIDIAATNGKSFVRSATVIADKVKRALPSPIRHPRLKHHLHGPDRTVGCNYVTM